MLLTCGRYVLLQLGLGAVAITLGSFPIFVRVSFSALLGVYCAFDGAQPHLQVPNASQLQLAGVPSFWSSLSLVMGSRNWFWISLGKAAPRSVCVVL
jgi:hypothetical protein